MSSAARFQRRKGIWIKETSVLPRTRHLYWWVLHNCVSHPVLGLIPGRPTIWFHDWTSQRLNRRDEIRPSKSPKIGSYWKWLWHNTAGHVAIGLLPVGFSFRFHDRTSRNMAVRGWV